MTASNRRVGWGTGAVVCGGGGDLETRSCAVDSDLLLLSMDKLKLAYCYNISCTLNLNPDISIFVQNNQIKRDDTPVRVISDMLLAIMIVQVLCKVYNKHQHQQ